MEGKMDKRTIPEWEKEFKVKIYDPDGFDRKDRDLYKRLFTREEFERGMMRSTLNDSRGLFCQS